MKILVLNNNDSDKSFDIIISDGGYAFCYENDEGICIDYYQGRITDRQDYPADEICLNNSYKVYNKKYPFNTPNLLIIADAYNWLTTSDIKDAEEIIFKNIRKHAEHHINEFLFKNEK